MNSSSITIVELSASQSGKFEAALRIIEEAYKANVDVVKLQAYAADPITLNSDVEKFKVRGGLWDSHVLYDFYQQARKPRVWYSQYFEYVGKIGVAIFSSPLDSAVADLLEIPTHQRIRLLH